MDNKEIDRIVREIVNEVVESKSENIGLNLEEHELTDYNINSITFIMLVVKLESEFDVEFEDNNLLMDKYQSFSDLVDIISLKVNSVELSGVVEHEY